MSFNNPTNPTHPTNPANPTISTRPTHLTRPTRPTNGLAALAQGLQAQNQGLQAQNQGQIQGQAQGRGLAERKYGLNDHNNSKSFSFRFGPWFLGSWSSVSLFVVFVSPFPLFAFWVPFGVSITRLLFALRLSLCFGSGPGSDFLRLRLFLFRL